MLDANIEQQLGLAGVCQAAQLVQSVARTGQADSLSEEEILKLKFVTF